MTLDGVVEASEKRNPPYYDDEMTQAVMGQIAAAGTHLHGLHYAHADEKWP